MGLGEQVRKLISEKINETIKFKKEEEGGKTLGSKEPDPPTVPNHIPALTPISEEAELEALEREMALA